MNPQRFHTLNSTLITNGTVVYWMSRDQRVADNWALLHAQALALELRVPLAVVFTLADSFLGATLRQYGFMLRGLAQVEERLEALQVPLILLRGNPPDEICRFVKQNAVGALVTDFDPLRIKCRWREHVALHSGVACIEVDAHNIVPCRIASGKQEYGAYTLRPKLNRLLPEFLTDYPKLVRHPFAWTNPPHPSLCKVVSIPAILESLPVDRTVAEVALVPGESAAHTQLLDFITSRLDRYDHLRNDPNADGQSGLSPYLHFGQIAPQRVALEAARHAGGSASGDAFLEELIVRRELSDNFCWYNQEYDRIDGFPVWALKTTAEHRHDRREYVYKTEQFDRAATHDMLWNAAQQEMVTSGRMHGYLRMYWAKKIL
ncbi:MAG: deoxyribodipyrimidine photo-lyase, partial [bacterium]